MTSFCFQHEEASVKMFNHLVEENKLKKKFKELSDLNMSFIREQISGKPEGNDVRNKLLFGYF